MVVTTPPSSHSLRMNSYASAIRQRKRELFAEAEGILPDSRSGRRGADRAEAARPTPLMPSLAGELAKKALQTGTKRNAFRRRHVVIVR
jgi:hypothetical protein